MRVAIDGRALGSGRGGDETYTRGLLTGLAEAMDPADSFPLFVRQDAVLPPAIVGNPGFPVHVVRHRSELLRYAVALPLALTRIREGLDLLHSLIYAPPWSPVPVALMVTDLSFRHLPDLYRASTRLRLAILMPRQLRRARVVMTLSEFCRQDITREYGVPADRVFVVPCAVETPSPATPDPQALRALGVSTPFFLYVGNRHPRKNVPRMIRAFGRARRAAPELSRHQLVIAGARWWAVRDELEAAAETPPGSVRFLEHVPTSTRDLLLRSAEALVYPSLFEGFGLPPLEAMAVGTPAIVSNASAIPEIVGDAALLADPFDIDALARAMVIVVTTPGLRAELRERGFRRVAMFTPRAMGERALAAFRAAVPARRD